MKWVKNRFQKTETIFFWHVKLSSHKSSYVYCYYRSKRSLVLYGKLFWKLPLLGCGFLRFTLRFEIISAKLKALWKLWKMLLISPFFKLFLFLRYLNFCLYFFGQIGKRLDKLGLVSTLGLVKVIRLYRLDSK